MLTLLTLPPRAVWPMLPIHRNASDVRKHNDAVGLQRAGGAADRATPSRAPLSAKAVRACSSASEHSVPHQHPCRLLDGASCVATAL